MSLFERLKRILEAEIDERLRQLEFKEKFKNGNQMMYEEWLRMQGYTPYEEPVQEPPRRHEQQQRKEQSPPPPPKAPSKETEYHQWLEVRPGATFAEIKAAYRRLMKQFHPDLFQGKPEQHKAALEVTRRLNEAYSYFEEKYRNK